MSHNPQYLIDLTQTILPKHNAYIKHYFHFKQNRPGGIRLMTKQVIWFVLINTVGKTKKRL